MDRKDVYAAIDSERDFQVRLTADNDRPDMISEFHVGDGLSAIEINLQKAREAWYINSDPHEGAMKYLRKIAALCVYLGETYGMPKRS